MKRLPATMQLKAARSLHGHQQPSAIDMADMDQEKLDEEQYHKTDKEFSHCAIPSESMR